MKAPEVRFALGATSVAGLPRDGRAQVAFLGPSNVGKSSLLNALAGGKAVARVSKTPGRTQQVNLFLVDEKFYLVDLPGYGFAKVPPAVHAQLKKLIESYLAEAKDLRLLVVLMDVRRDPSPRDLELLRTVRDRGTPHVVVLTKSDKVSRSELNRRASAVGESLCEALGSDAIELMPVSSVTGQGRAELWELVTRVARDARR